MNAAPTSHNRSNIEEIKARLPIEDVISQYIKLDKAGKSFKGKCPFHNEKTASFFVSPDRSGYYCFGCGAKGDIFSFVEHFEGLDFKGALKVLADKAGVQLVFDQKADSERDRLFQIMEEAMKYFETQLTASNPGATEARTYVSARGIDEKTRTEFHIGWAPEGWRNLYDYLLAKKWPKELIVKAGLAKEASDKPGTFYDRFRGRIMFPLNDSGGRVIAFSGRILPRLDDGKAAKYLNSPDTPLFDKSSVLYGLDKAKSYIRRLDYSILVEGQMDLIMSHQAGVRNTVASSGTALSDAESDRNGVVNNLGLLRRLSQNAIIAFDSDDAGRKAAMRAATIALSLGMDVKIADIQGGKDPADLVLADPESWKNILRAAKPVVEFELGNVVRECSADPRKIPKVLRERVLPFVLALESSTDRAYAVKQIADQTDLPESAVWEDVRALEKKAKAETGVVKTAVGASQGRVATPAARIDLVERRIFGLLDLMEKARAPKAAEYRTMLTQAAQGSLDQMIERMRPFMGELSFEAEALYGAEPERWDIHMAELLANFEEDMLNRELISAMGALRAAERAGDQTALAELAKKSQMLSVRKAEIAKRRKS